MFDDPTSASNTFATDGNGYGDATLIAPCCATEATLYFSSNSSAQWNAIDSLSYTEMPEPGTYALLGPGLLLLGLASRKLARRRL